MSNRRLLVAMDMFDAAQAAQQMNYSAAVVAVEAVRAETILRSLKKKNSSVSYYILPRSLHFFRCVFPVLNERRFREHFRFDREGFYLIVGAVESHMWTHPPPGCWRDEASDHFGVE